MSKKNLLLIVAAAGTAATVANAQPYVVNTFGATLLENLLVAPAMTNDYLDLDGDGNATRLNGSPDNLASALPSTPSVGFVPGNLFVHQYRAIGSVNGLQELLDWGGKNSINGPYALTGDQTVGMRADAATTARANRNTFVTNGAPAGGLNTYYNSANGGGVPFRSSTTGTFIAQPLTANGTASNGGVRNDIAPVDVPSTWGVTVAGAAFWSRTPGSAGYGTSPENSTTGFSNRLVDVSDGFNLAATNGGNNDAKTVFDTEFTFAPIPAYVGYGVGDVEMTYTELQHHYVTGRGKTGENLMIITRDTGSGTHNGHMNSLAIDPSWGVGENVGPLNTSSSNQVLGSSFLPGNKGGSGAMEGTLRNVRLSIGYSGGERWAGSQNLSRWVEIIGVRNDLNGRTAGDFARPTIDRLLNNGLTGEIDPTDGSTYTRDGFRLGGRAVFATIGDPRQVPANLGGYGFISGEANPGTPAMDNQWAAAFINNLSRSVDAFNALPGSDQTVFSPGEFVAARFIPINATDYSQSLTSGTAFSTNAVRSQAMQDFQAGNALSTFNSQAARYAAPYVADTTRNGWTPERLGSAALVLSTVYSDGTPAAQAGQPNGSFLADDGTTRFSYNTALTATRNRIMGDFNGDGLRNINDTEWMIRAWIERNGGTNITLPDYTGANPASDTSGSLASFEILGDFSCDGNFGRKQTGGDASAPIFSADFADVRYFADGLALNATTGNLDRKAGFTAVDMAFNTFGGSNNFFGTTKALGTYAMGDSRADIAGGASSPIPGYIPTGSDGVINAADVDYVSTQIAKAADRSVQWSDLNDSASANLSADMNGDLVIDCNDISEILVTILGTSVLDLNLDGVVNGADEAIVTANLGTMNAVWSQGDVNCDGMVNAADAALFGGGLPQCNSIDFNGDGLFPDDGDLIDFLNVQAGGACSNDPNCDSNDFNNDGLFPDDADLIDFLTVLAGGTPASCTP